MRAPARFRWGWAIATIASIASAIGAPTPSPASAEEPPRVRVRFEETVTASDGVPLHVIVSGEGPLEPRPLVMDFSPYAPGGTARIAGTNQVTVHLRGTGLSGGSWDLMGEREQRDVAEVMAWACRQPWSNGRIGLVGQSANAITAYNAMRRPLPCLVTAALVAGTAAVYHDIAYPGGIPGVTISTGYAGLVLLPYLQALPDRLQRARPALSGDAAAGFAAAAASYLAHPTADEFWQTRAFTQPAAAPTVPILAVTGFYDIESPGPFTAFRLTRHLGSHLLVIGAHEAGPPGYRQEIQAATQAWFDHHLLGIDNGVDAQAPVRALVPHGGLEGLLEGRYTEVHGSDWPLEHTDWLSMDVGAGSYPFLPSNPLFSDPHDIAAVMQILQQYGVETSTPVPLTDAALTEGAAFTAETGPFDEPVLMAGPASLEVTASSTSGTTDLVAILADVDPDGGATPIASGRLRTEFPALDEALSVRNDSGDVVLPYGDFTTADPPAPGEARRYHVEVWPFANRFEAGHRLRLYLLGTPLTMLPAIPGVTTVEAGRLLLPVLRAAASPPAPSPPVTVPGPVEPPPPRDADRTLPATGGRSSPLAAGAAAAALALLWIRRSVRS